MKFSRIMRHLIGRLAVALLLVVCTLQCTKSSAQTNTTVRIGYANLAFIKSKQKSWLDYETFRANGQKNLEAQVAAGNSRIQELKDRKAPAAEIQALTKQIQTELNRKQKETIDQANALYKAALDATLAAVAQVAAANLDIVVDVQSVYGGGQLVVENGIDVTGDVLKALAVDSAGTHAAISNGEAAKPIAVTISHFDLLKVKAADQLSVDSSAVRTDSEALLRRYADEGNAKLVEMQKTGRPKEEITAYAAQLRAEISSKQQMLVESCKKSVATAQQHLLECISGASKARNCTISLDRDGVLLGKSLVDSKGLDITQAAVASVAPGQGSVASAVAPSTPSSNAAATFAGSILPATAVSGSSPSASTSTSASAPAPASIPAPPASSVTSSSDSSSSTSSSDSPIRDKWAVIIGISKFANPQYNLLYSAKDAADFRDYLISEAHFKPDHVLTLLNEQATRANIMRAFGSKWLPNLAEPGDLVVVYISTHGTPSSADSGARNYIVGYDTDANDLYATAVDMDELARRIKEIKTDRAVIVLDTCYSGGGIPGSRGLSNHDSFDLKKIEVGKGHVVISASSPNERSWESKSLQNGVFTRHLIDSLRQTPDSDLRTAFEKCSKQVQWEVKRDHGFSQTPQMGGTWEGKPLILSLPATDSRPMSQDKFAEFGPSFAASGKAPAAAKPQTPARPAVAH